MIRRAELVGSIKLKLDRCLRLVAPMALDYSIFLYHGFFDYDPIANKSFMGVMCSYIGDDELVVRYLDVGKCSMQREFSLLRSEMLRSNKKLMDFKLKHAQLHDCTVEGSYFLFGDKNEWVVFYDAQAGAGILLVKNESLLEDLRDYVV